MGREEWIGVANKQMFDRGEINLQEKALEFMKNMNQQQLVDFLLSNDHWHVKTSGINASGS